MPIKTLGPMAKRAGKSTKQAEAVWKEAKQEAIDSGRKESAPDFYPYVMGIFKRMMGLETAHVTAVQELASKAKQSSAAADKSYCDSLAEALKGFKMPVKRIEYPTRIYEGAVILVENSKWVVSLQIPGVGKSFRPELLNVKTDTLKSGRATKTMAKAVTQLKEMIKTALQKNNAAKPPAGLKVAVDKTVKPTVEKKPAFGSSAMKVRNYLMKLAGGGRALKNYSSNAYSDSQVLELSVNKEHHAKIVTGLKAAGLVSMKSKYYAAHLCYVLDDVRVEVPLSVRSSFNKAKPGAAIIKIYGSKKAKPTTIPYYD